MSNGVANKVEASGPEGDSRPVVGESVEPANDQVDELGQGEVPAGKPADVEERNEEAELQAEEVDQFDDTDVGNTEKDEAKGKPETAKPEQPEEEMLVEDEPVSVQETAPEKRAEAEEPVAGPTVDDGIDEVSPAVELEEVDAVAVEQPQKSQPEEIEETAQKEQVSPKQVDVPDAEEIVAEEPVPEEPVVEPEPVQQEPTEAEKPVNEEPAPEPVPAVTEPPTEPEDLAVETQETGVGFEWTCIASLTSYKRILPKLMINIVSLSIYHFCSFSFVTIFYLLCIAVSYPYYRAPDRGVLAEKCI